MREFLRQFMLYSRAERRAVVALVVLILLVIILPRGYHYYIMRADAPHFDTLAAGELAQLKAASSETAAKDSAAEPLNMAGELFEFDPNVIGATDWIKLGLTDKQAAVIEKYRSKGGRFYKPDDLRKIYVLSDEMKDRLVPYVRIEATPESTLHTIEINSADSAAYEALYGIGPWLAHHIVKYREELGGFYSIDQVRETRGLSDSTFRLIKPYLSVNPALVRKININEADYESLRRHPYIRAKIAHAMIGYRNYNGRFESLDELSKVKGIDDDAIRKIKPYLEVRQ
jgi:competence protein ComEA